MKLNILLNVYVFPLIKKKKKEYAIHCKDALNSEIPLQKGLLHYQFFIV